MYRITDETTGSRESDDGIAPYEEWTSGELADEMYARRLVIRRGTRGACARDRRIALLRADDRRSGAA